MTDLFKDNQQRAGEDRQAIAAMAEADGKAPALFDGSSTLPTTELPTPGTSESPREATNGTAAPPLADNVESVPEENVVGANAQGNEICGSSTQPPSPIRPDGDPGELHTQIKRMIAGRTRLPDSVSTLVAFWAISTWFQDAFTVFPCLVISGPAHEAMVLLGILRDLCRTPTLLAGLKRGDFKELTGYRTLLISEPNLDNRTAALLGNLTNRHFLLIEQGSYLSCAGSRAIYIGEDITIKRIQHSLYIDVTTPPHVDFTIPSQSWPETIGSLRNRLVEYRDRNLSKVSSLEFNPCGLSLEAHAMANALGSCIVDAPQLQAELVALLRPQNQQQIADRSDSVEALVAGAALALCHQDKDEIYVKEITSEVNRLLVARGETMQLTPEKAGHKLKKVGLFTRRLSQAGNGLTLDQATRIRIHEVARAFLGEDFLPETENLHCQLCLQTKGFRKVM
jgi:hypothetical protein